MNKLLEKIFIESGFRIYYPKFLEDGQNKNFFAVNESINKKEYFLITFFDYISKKKLTDLINRQAFEYYSNLKKLSFYEKEMQKNTSLIICLKEKKLTLDRDKKKSIYEVEEDLYNFKKYVLVYTERQIQDFESNYITYKPREIKLIKHLQNILNNSKSFKQFKFNLEEDTFYNLITKLFIKLPFLNLKTLKSATLENLEQKIKEELKIIETFDFIDTILQKNEIEDMDEENFLSEIGVIE
ncbi:ABC-three component system middle component 1 [Halonatronum saccharophilum]|uniref:ABC-three component system middle component 1 n=1 Tax=Halonatronum saccharophilum TaxID=150060 RepID=UPI00047F6ECB|nr:ABC-three component system middle component 1 [Halonatronum saccharophilum]